MKVFVQIHHHIFDIFQVYRLDLEKIEELTVLAWVRGHKQPFIVKDSQAIDLVMAIKPSSLEGKRLRWVKRAWMIHNLVGHPLAQLFANFGQYKLAMRVHDATIPRPLGRR